MALLGVGLIGGSLAIDCRKKGLVGSVAGYGRKEENLRKAISLGVIESYDLNIENVVAGADLVILATPIGSYLEIVKKILPALSSETILTDVGSVKEKVVDELESVLKGVRFVPGHPVAGREKSGVEAAIPDLFKGARCILTPTGSTDTSSLEKIRALWEEVGALVSILKPREHDEILGMVSHLPHLVAYAMVNTVLEASKGNAKLVSYSGGGFRDFTRIGASSPEMWKDIFFANREIILDQIGKFESVLASLKRNIQERDEPALLNQFEKSKKLKESLN